MLRLYKRTTIAYYVLITAGAVGFVECTKLIESPLIGCLIAAVGEIIWIMLVNYSMSAIATMIQNRSINKYYRECNMHTMADAISKQIKKERNEYIKNALLMNLSAAYLNGGQFDHAKNALDNVDVSMFSANESGLQNRFVYCNNYCMYFSCMKDIERAEYVLSDMKKIIDNPEIDDNRKKLFLNLYNTKKEIVNMLKGNFDSAECVFKNMFEKEQTMLHKVSAKYNLGLIAEHFGKIDDAREAFTFVAKNGGDTFFAENAKQKLQQTEKCS